ncbi:MAG: acyl carrier protein [Peptococcaceae bacterium]|nr:acyl carrier protein [Peptococcaceae bacterium]
MKVSKQTILKKIVELLQEILECEDLDVNSATLLNTLGLNSFERVDLILSLEKEYRVVIPDKMVFVFQTVDDVMSFILASIVKKPDTRSKIIS